MEDARASAGCRGVLQPESIREVIACRWGGPSAGVVGLEPPAFTVRLLRVAVHCAPGTVGCGCAKGGAAELEVYKGAGSGRSAVSVLSARFLTSPESTHEYQLILPPHFENPGKYYEHCLKRCCSRGPGLVSVEAEGGATGELWP